MPGIFIRANVWVNEAELNGTSGIDDDDNGYIDDIYGYDFINNDGDPTDDAGHGTHCSGTIAAAGDNGLNVVGVCWNARVMGLKFLGAGGSGSTDDAVDAFYYAVENGADVTSNSWGGGGYSTTMEEAINYAYSQGVVMVAAAGNDGDTDPQYPAYYDNMISVAATDSDDQKASFSTYGDWVDIAAPGVSILSLRASGGTATADGTSMACPHVAGASALLLSANPLLTPDEVYTLLTETVDPIAPEVCISGRLNIGNAILGATSSKGVSVLTTITIHVRTR
jgi:subtilisin family serine protease